MGLTVYWTQFAEDKLEDIYNYYKYKVNARVAANLINGIVDATLDLDKKPFVGQKEKLLSERLQEFRYIV